MNQNSGISLAEKAECARLKAIWLAAKYEMGLSQEGMAAELGMTQGNLGHYLNGRQALTLDVILRLAVRLGFKPSAVRSDLYFLDPAFGGSATDTAPVIGNQSTSMGRPAAPNNA